MERFKCDDCVNRVIEKDESFSSVMEICDKEHWMGLGFDLSDGKDVYNKLWDNCLDYKKVVSNDTNN